MNDVVDAMNPNCSDNDQSDPDEDPPAILEPVGSWEAMSEVNAPSLRSWFSMVWTGTEVIVWGGGIEST